MDDWVPGLIAAAPALAGVGALFWRVGRLEQDVKDRATKESVEHLQQQLAKIERLLEKIDERLSVRREDINRSG